MLAAILCADWGKEFPKRAVYVADVSARVVRRVGANGWTVSGVLGEAKRWSSSGPVLATFDAPLGVPASYLAAVGTVPSAKSPASFLDLLVSARSMRRFFDASSFAADWSAEQPFFSVPSGDGGLRSYSDAAARRGVDLYRRIDRLTGAKSVFVKSGIPGSVGSAACTLWQELASELTPQRSFRVWPFDGDLQALLDSTPVVMAEIYPRAAYATALLDVTVASRPPLVVAKTDPGVRREAIRVLRAANWVRWLGVSFENLDQAEANEDDFDACLTAAALLRCVLDGSPLCPAHLDDAWAEGGMLGTGSVNLSLPAKMFDNGGRAQQTVVIRPLQPRRVDARVIRGPAADRRSDGVGSYRCPIDGCVKVFQGSRGGWDAHVASLRQHQHWHPELRDANDRKRCFEREFPGFFR